MIITEKYIQLPLDERQQHLDLKHECIERGGSSTHHKGVLAQYLNTDIPSKGIDLCHACNNHKCSNPKHLYWGTRKENIQDAKKVGSWKSAWENTVEKYGYEEACRMNKNNSNPARAGAGNKGKSKSEEHKQKISESLKTTLRMREH